MKADRPSATARLIAAAAVHSSYSEDERPMLAPGAAEASVPLLQLTRGGRLLFWLIRRGWGRRLLRVLERCTLPRLTRHFLLRKRHLRQSLERLHHQGYRQLVVLGAGMDLLAAHAACDLAMCAIEVDHPATQALKRRVYGDTPGLTMLAWDLSTPGVGAAVRAALDPARPTLIIAEGLLMYLPEEQVRTLLAEVQRMTDGPLTLLATAMERQPRRVGFRRKTALVNIWLALNGEPFRWGTTCAEAETLMRDVGFRPLECRDIAHLPGASPRELEGELLIHAERPG
jgi:methyltransferase (TIGR00027 family)